MSSLSKLTTCLYGMESDRASIRILKHYKAYEDNDPLVKMAMDDLGIAYRHLIPVALASETVADMSVINVAGLDKDKAVEALTLTREANEANPQNEELLVSKVEEISILTGIPVDVISIPFSSPKENYNTPSMETYDLGLEEMRVSLEEHIVKVSKRELANAKNIIPTISSSLEALVERANEVYLDIQDHTSPVGTLELPDAGNNPLEDFAYIFTGEGIHPKSAEVVSKADVIDMLSFIMTLNGSYYVDQAKENFKEIEKESDKLIYGESPTYEEILTISTLADEAKEEITHTSLNIVSEVHTVLDAVEEGFFSKVGKGVKNAVKKFWEFIVRMFSKLGRKKDSATEGGKGFEKEKKEVKEFMKDIKKGKYSETENKNKSSNIYLPNDKGTEVYVPASKLHKHKMALSLTYPGGKDGAQHLVNVKRTFKDVQDHLHGDYRKGLIKIGRTLGVNYSILTKEYRKFKQAVKNNATGSSVHELYKDEIKLPTGNTTPLVRIHDKSTSLTLVGIQSVVDVKSLMDMLDTRTKTVDLPTFVKMDKAIALVKSMYKYVTTDSIQNKIRANPDLLAADKRMRRVVKKYQTRVEFALNMEIMRLDCIEANEEASTNVLKKYLK